MCGIAGIYNSDGQAPDGGVLARMAATIAHRGPQGERFYTDGGVGLAHRHLRIIDLSDAAMQPMTNEVGTLWLTFNGEIYNYIELRPLLEQRGHRFHTSSDTEVLLHAYEEWGVDCLHRFNGMFAFALWDSPRQRLFLARDRIGVKPLYYWWHNRTLAFASEIKALLAHPDITPRPNVAAIAEYMNTMYTMGEQTWFVGVKRLLPGHYMLASKEGISVRQWWQLPANEDAPGERPERYYTNKTREILEDSVRLRLRADVPLGAHLSGGLDSSTVVALLSKHLEPQGETVRTFSGAFAEGEAYDERRYVRAVVEQYHTQHHETLPTAQDLPRLLDSMTWHMDEPTAGPGLLLQYAVCKLTKESGVTVINGGQGGDEAWGGYFRYLPPYLRTLVIQARRRPGLYGEVLKDALTLFSRPDTRRSLLRAVLVRGRGRLRPSTGLGAWAGDRFRSEAPSIYLRQHIDSGARGRTPLSAMMYHDMKWYLPALLHVEDRTSMAFSLESRAPLLDYRLIEHAATVPSELKLKNVSMKHILRQSVKDLLPPSVYRRTDKMGMPTPLSIWFRGSLASWISEELLSESAHSTGLLDRAYVERMVQEHQSGSKDRSNELWKMLSLVAWWRVYMVQSQAERGDKALPKDSLTQQKATSNRAF